MSRDFMALAALFVETCPAAPSLIKESSTLIATAAPTRANVYAMSDERPVAVLQRAVG